MNTSYSRTFTEVYKNSPNKSHDEPSFGASKHNQPKIKTNISTDSIHSSAGWGQADQRSKQGSEKCFQDPHRKRDHEK